MLSREHEEGIVNRIHNFFDRDERLRDKVKFFPNDGDVDIGRYRWYIRNDLIEFLSGPERASIYYETLVNIFHTMMGVGLDEFSVFQDHFEEEGIYQSYEFRADSKGFLPRKSYDFDEAYSEFEKEIDRLLEMLRDNIE